MLRLKGSLLGLGIFFVGTIAYTLFALQRERQHKRNRFERGSLHDDLQSIFLGGSRCLSRAGLRNGRDLADTRRLENPD